MTNASPVMVPVADWTQNPNLQEAWPYIYENCALSIQAISDDFNIDERNLRDWIRSVRVPRAKNFERMVEIMGKLIEDKKLEYHPSYGYATEQQIEKLKTLGHCPERDAILKAIEKQTKNRGKKR